MSTLEFFSRRRSEFLHELEAIVTMDTPTGDAERVAELTAVLREAFTETGSVEQVSLQGYGPLLRVRRPGVGSRVLLLAHSDTVWPVGSWQRPWLERDGRIYGPGVYDMKCGLLFIVWLMRWLEEVGRAHPELVVVVNPDEEVGSPESRAIIEAEATAADFALVLEPASPEGHLKLRRKGSGEYVVQVTGRPAHQGVEPEEGVNAIVEAAHQVLEMLELQDLAGGTSVGPNLISGGTASNTVAPSATIWVDVRAWSRAEQRRLDRGLRRLEPRLEGASISLRGQWNRPPMEASEASEELFSRARHIGAGLGLDLSWVAWGGSSDANLTAAVGTPTMDGLGPVGDDAHQFTEHIVTDQIPVRMALLAELVASLSVAPEEWMSPGGLRDLRHRALPSR